MEKQPEALGSEKAPEKQLDEKELERKLKKDQKAKEKEEKRLKAKQKEAARLQAQATSDGPKKSEKKQRKKSVEDENPDDFIDPNTPQGRKKLLAPQMAKQYSPSVVEKSWYAWWESSGYFGADSGSTKPAFVIVLPPPNVTGALHIGHALTVAIEDAMIRWRRMSGYNALWVPGVDHAGIATQVLKWKEQYGDTILNQLRQLEVSLDWSCEAFTMDEQRSKASTEASLASNYTQTSELIDLDWGNLGFGILQTGYMYIAKRMPDGNFADGEMKLFGSIALNTSSGVLNYGQGLYKDTKENEMKLVLCSRTNDVVEPMIRPQWFVNCNTMAKAGLDAVRSKKIEIIPQQYEQDWYRVIYLPAEDDSLQATDVYMVMDGAGGTGVVIFDTGSPINCTGDRSLIPDHMYKEVSGRNIYGVGNKVLDILGCGPIHDTRFQIDDVYYIPDLNKDDIKKTIISGPWLDKHGYHYSCGQGKCTVWDPTTHVIVGEGYLYQGKYELDYLKIPLLNGSGQLPEAPVLEGQLPEAPVLEAPVPAALPEGPAFATSMWKAVRSAFLGFTGTLFQRASAQDPWRPAI